MKGKIQYTTLTGDSSKKKKKEEEEFVNLKTSHLERKKNEKE